MDENIWQQKPSDVARLLIGKLLVVGSTQAWILQAQGFRRAENSNGIYRPILEMQPGGVYCPRRRNWILLLIVTRDGNHAGGCVLVRSVEIGGRIFDGPGHVTDELGITQARACGRADVVDQNTVSIHFESVLQSQPPRPRTVPVFLKGGITLNTIERLMPRIASVYLRLRPQPCFEDYANHLVELSQNNEGRLRQILDALERNTGSK